MSQSPLICGAIQTRGGRILKDTEWLTCVSIPSDLRGYSDYTNQPAHQLIGLWSQSPLICGAIQTEKNNNCPYVFKTKKSQSPLICGAIQTAPFLIPTIEQLSKVSIPSDLRGYSDK